MDALGIEVTGWQHPDDEPLDWEVIHAAGYRVAWIKATQGTDWVADYLAEDVLSATAAGIVCGAWHYAAPGQGEAAEQAQLLMAACHGLDLGLGYALDLSTTGTLDVYSVAAFGQAFVAELAAGGRPRTLRCPPSWVGTTLAGAPWGAEWWLSPIGRPADVSALYTMAGGPVRVYSEGPYADTFVLTSTAGINPSTLHRPRPTPAPAEGPTTVPVLPAQRVANPEARLSPPSEPGSAPGGTSSPDTGSESSAPAATAAATS